MSIFDALERIFMENLQKFLKIATSARLRDEKVVGAVLEAVTHFIGKLTTCSISPKLI